MKALFYPDYPFETLFVPQILKEIYVDRIYANTSKDGMVVVDAGANIGLVAHYFQPFASMVYAIEPSPEHYKALSANKILNDWNNVKCFECALSDLNGWATLHRFNVNRTGHSIVYDRETSDTVLVPTIRLDRFFEDNEIDRVDLLKLDVEGAEDLVLRGGGFDSVCSKIDQLIVEFHNPDWLELVNFIKDFGYSCEKIYTGVRVMRFWRPK